MRALGLALVLTASMPVDAAACHHFHTWRFPWPQRCGHQADPGRPLAVRLASLTPPPVNARPEPPVSLGMPLPALGPVEGVEANDATAWLMLRMMENAHGH